MTIRKAGIFAGSILIILFLVSCATTQKTAETDSELIILGSEQNPNKLAKNQMLSVTQRVDKPRLLEVTNWSKVRILSDLLDAMKGHSDFSNDEKYTLLTYIFDNLPISGNDGVVREVYIGKFFNNGDPLIIRIAVFTPNAEMAKINEKAIVLMTNIVNLPNDQSNRERGLIGTVISGFLRFRVKIRFFPRTTTVFAPRTTNPIRIFRQRRLQEV